MADLFVVAERVRRVYPQCRDARAAFRIAMCALSSELRNELLMCQVGRRSCVEMTCALKTPLDEAAMSVDELCELLVQIGTDGLCENRYVDAMLSVIDDALVITMQSPPSRQVWESASVKLLVCFALLLELTGPVLTKLFGQVGRSDMRRLEALQDAWHSRRANSDAHLNALNHIVDTFAVAV